MPNKKEPLSIIAVKTLLVVLLFAGVGTIIIGGGYLIGKQRKVHPVSLPVSLLPISEISEQRALESANRLLQPKCNTTFLEIKKARITKTFIYHSPKENICSGIKEYMSNHSEIWIAEKTLVNEAPVCTPDMPGTCTQGKLISAVALIGLNGEFTCGYALDRRAAPGILKLDTICEQAKEVTITTDKTEYDQGETVEITVKNNSDNLIKHLKGVGCGLQGFSNKEWRNVSSRSCRWDGENKLKPNSEYNFNWTVPRLGLEKYRIAFYYQEQKVIETKEIGKIICEGEGFMDELERLLLNGKWARGDSKGSGAMCDACFVCSSTMEDAWSIDDEISIDVHNVSCVGNSYTIKYKDEEYDCVPENYKNPLQRLLIPIPPEDWKTTYSNEFTIKEKSALDPRCNEKVVGSGDCDCFKIGYEFDIDMEKCIEKGASGCSVESPFKTLKECQDVCEKDNKEVKYQIFSIGSGTSDREEIIDYAYIYKNDKLPKTIKLEDNIVTVQKIEIQKTGGFMAYVTILYNGKEKKIGFWHPDGKVRNEENGCLDKNNKQVCGGILAMNIKEWKEEPTKEEKEKGILSVTYLKRFFLGEIDYDFNSNDWNYIKINLGSFGSYRDLNYPMTTF